MRKFFVAALAAAVVCVSAAQSQAALSIRLTDSIGTTTVSDGDGDGILQFSGAVGNWNINLTTAISKPVNGTAAMPYIDVQSANRALPGASVLTIEVSDDNFGGIDPNVFKTTLSSSTGLNPGITLNTFIDSGNVLFATPTSLGSTSVVGVAGDTDNSGAVATGNPYSLTMVFKVSPVANTTINSTGTLEAVVPEATSVAVWGGLSLLGLVGRRRRG